MADISGMLRRLPGAIRDDIGTPVYLQIASILKNWIVSGMLQTGTLLPAERTVCEHFRVSRMTLREAYDILERDGFIERHRGRGTFVAPHRVRKQQQEMRSFTEELMARGLRASSKLLFFRRSRMSTAAHQFFGLPESEMIYEIQRLRIGDDVPLAIETVQIPCYLCPDLEHFDLTTASLYSILEQNYGLDLIHCVEEVSAELADRTQKTLFGLRGSSAVLVIRRKTYSTNGTPVELALTVYRADQYRAIVHAVRPRQST
jgi:GntR family transcriptional regulator